MSQKLTFCFSILLVLAMSAGLFLAVANLKAAAAEPKTQNFAIVLTRPETAIAGPAGATLLSQAVLTQTTTYVTYLPLVFSDFCATSFSFNETILYNLSLIGAEEAWQNCGAQGQDVTVAVIDTGVDLDHTDLQANLVSGKSFVSGTSSADDDHGHGTHVAGIIAAVSNNGGVIGVAPAASIMPVKVLDSQGSGSIYDVAAGIEWAADNGATVINLSLGSVSSSSTLQTAVNYAYNKGVLLVAAGGNCGDSAYYYNDCTYQDQPVYPGAYANVMAVASVTGSSSQSSFSNQGSYIEIAAPGSSIYSAYPGGGYTTLSGTSMAAPHVAGLAALVWSQYTTLTNAEVRAQIDNAAQDLGSSGWDSQFGYGLIDAAAALASLQPSTTAVPVSAETAAATTTSDSAYVPGEILVKLRDGFSVNNVIAPAQLATAEVQVLDTIDEIGAQKLAVTAGQEQAWLTQLRNSAGVEYAELNYVVTITDSADLPQPR